MTETVNATRTGTADVGRGITLAFEQWRNPDPDAPVMLLVAGLGQQLISWPEPLCEMFVAHGFHVVRFDNRDSGASTHVDAPPPGPLALVTRRFPTDRYGLHDMAKDAIGLLDALGHERAHLLGASMGGMIAQTMAYRWPTRVTSLTSLFSTTGARGIGRPALSTWIKMAASPPKTEDEAERAELRFFDHVGSQGFAQDRSRIAHVARASFARDPCPDGAGRQLAAILADGDRTEEVRRIEAPTLVIHGDRDRMVAPSGGRATHSAVPGSSLWIVPGLGHDYPPDFWQPLADRVAVHATAAEAAGKVARTDERERKDAQDDAPAPPL